MTFRHETELVRHNNIAIQEQQVIFSRKTNEVVHVHMTKKQFSPGAEYFLVYIMKVTFELATASYFIHSDEYTTPCPTYYSPVCRQLAYKSSV